PCSRPGCARRRPRSTMTSEAAGRAFVWIWLPDATEPVVAGVLQADGPVVRFAYGQSYLARTDAVALYLPELPLGRGAIEPLGNLTMAGCIDDAAPTTRCSGARRSAALARRPRSRTASGSSSP